VNTLAVASSPNAWTQPVSSCSAPVSRVSRGAARHAHRTICAMVRGTATATSRKLACTTFSYPRAQYGVSMSSTPISGMRPPG
jgi:hypothetical protein